MANFKLETNRIEINRRHPVERRQQAAWSSLFASKGCIETRRNIILTNLVFYKTFPKGKGRMFFTLDIH